jgi:hypothetical protein
MIRTLNTLLRLIILAQMGLFLAKNQNQKIWRKYAINTGENSVKKGLESKSKKRVNITSSKIPNLGLCQVMIRLFVRMFTSIMRTK